MNKLVKSGVGAALALGAVAAHASITTPTSSSTTSTAILFADVFKNGTFVEAYAGDTGIQVSAFSSGTAPATFDDAGLANFLSTFATSGTVVYWALEGANNYGNAPSLVSSSAVKANLANQTGNSLFTGAVSLHGQVGNINGHINGPATFLTIADLTQNNGTGFNPLPTAGDISNWYGNTGNTSIQGLGTAGTIYTLTTPDIGSNTNAALTAVFTATLTSAGLSFAPIAVPIPAALWLLGSGLLGLAGVARRKVTGT